MSINRSINFCLGSFVLVMTLIGCKSQVIQSEAPFEIDQKVYHYWSEGQKGTHGTTIRLTGHTTSLNVSFSKLYFQNHEYDIVPQFTSHGFVIEGNYSVVRKNDMIFDKNPAEEYGNQPSAPEENIPFDLGPDEAILLYTVNGLEGYHKISGIQQTDKVSMP